MNSVCSKCGKPVYFAERKTSLGKNWHRACLKCEECGKVLTPGQHAEHKGRPYCHRPCYAALYGPKMMGYGSNVCSPANFRKSAEVTLHNGDTASDSPKMIYEWGGDRGANNSKSTPNTRQTKTSNGASQSPSPVAKRGASNNGASSHASTANGDIVQYPQQYDSETQELLQKIKDFNKYYEGKKRQSLSANSDNTSGDLVIQGPLRIYWGVSKPIQLQQFDDVPSNVPEANWRHSFVPGSHDQPQNQEVPDITSLRLDEPKSPVLNKGFDDSIIQTPPDGVVLRRTNIKKFNTVAYRGDSRPNKWKRASINGHIYNFDTRVFTPVVGSCTSVTVNSTNTTAEIIKILLEKFKIENQPDEYSLYLVSDVGGEKLLKDSDYPLLERVALGPDEVSGAKIYLRDKVVTPLKYSNKQIAVPEVVVEEEESKTESPTTTIPDEVEALIAIPEPVLRGILQKFSADEEGELKKIKARYDVAKRKIKEEISKIKTKM